MAPEVDLGRRVMKERHPDPPPDSALDMLIFGEAVWIEEDGKKVRIDPTRVRRSADGKVRLQNP